MAICTISQLSVFLRELNETMTWNEISRLPQFRLPDSKGIPPGTLYAIAWRERDPKDPVVRHILGLAPLENCGQCWQFKKYVPLLDRIRLRKQPRRLGDYKKQTLRLLFENRIVVQKEE